MATKSQLHQELSSNRNQ